MRLLILLITILSIKCLAVPDWFQKQVFEDKDYYFSVGVAEGEYAVAYEKARQAASLDLLARHFGQSFKMKLEVSSSTDRESVNKTITSDISPVWLNEVEVDNTSEDKEANSVYVRTRIKKTTLNQLKAELTYSNPKNIKISKLIIKTNPPDAKIKINGNDWDWNPLVAAFNPGQYNVEISAKNFKTEKKKIIIGLAGVYDYEINLTPQTGRLKVEANSKDAKISVKKDYIEIDWEANELPVGDYQLEITQELHETFQKIVTIEADKIAFISASLKSDVYQNIALNKVDNSAIQDSIAQENTEAVQKTLPSKVEIEKPVLQLSLKRDFESQNIPNYIWALLIVLLLWSTYVFIPNKKSTLTPVNTNIK